MGAIEKRDSGRWRARYWLPGGGRRSRTFDRKADAERWLATQRADVVRGDWIDPALGRMTFADWARRWEASVTDLRPTTLALNTGVVRNYLEPRFGTRPLARIATNDVRAMIAEELAAGTLSTSAIRRHVLVLSSVLGAAVADGQLGRNPCAGIKLPAAESREMRFLEAEQVASLADAIGEHYRPLVLTAAYVGLRWGELAGLAVDHIDLLRRRIRVDRQLVEIHGTPAFGPPKTRAGVRTVSVPSSLTHVLAAHLGTDAVQRSGLAFPTPSGTSMRRSNFNGVWRRAVDGTEERPGVFRGTEFEGLVFHELRHTAAALAIAQGGHPLAIKERLGHSSITVTMDTYGGLFPRLDEAIAEGLDAVLAATLRTGSHPGPGGGPGRAQVVHLPS